MQELIASDAAETLTFRWLETGAGTLVVLIHGIPTSPQLWRRVAPLVPGARLLAWEMVGYGRSWSQALGADISVRAQASHLHRWLDEAGIDKAVLVGHDLGGGVVQIAAIRRARAGRRDRPLQLDRVRLLADAVGQGDARARRPAGAHAASHVPAPLLVSDQPRT
jgi:pimeloyl-ACP methyl ester carboxylesterase